MKHIETCEYYVMNLIGDGKVHVKKIEGTKNPADLLTK